MVKIRIRTCLVCRDMFEVSYRGRIPQHFVCEGCREMTRLCPCGWPLEEDHEYNTCLRCQERKRGYNRRHKSKGTRAHRSQYIGGEYCNAAKPSDSLPRPYLRGIPTGKMEGEREWIELV